MGKNERINFEPLEKTLTRINCTWQEQRLKSHDVFSETAEAGDTMNERGKLEWKNGLWGSS